MVDQENNNYVKNLNPYLVYKKENAPINNDLISFYFQINQLKNLYRQGWIRKRLGMEYINQCESVADHCFGLALLAIGIIDKYSLDYDVEKVLKLALLHELGEIYVGDYIPFDNITKEEKHEQESGAIKRLLESVNFDNSYYETWLEFESASSEEAVFVKELDGLEFLFQGTCYNLDVSYLNYSISKVTSPLLKSIVQDLIETTKGKNVQ